MEDLKTNAEILSDARSRVAVINSRIEADESKKLSITSPYLKPWTRDVTIGELNRRELRWRDIAPNPSARLRCLQVVHVSNMLDWQEPEIFMVRVSPDNLFDPPKRGEMLDDLISHLGNAFSVGDTIKIEGGWAVAISGEYNLPDSIPGFSIRRLEDRELSDLGPSTQSGTKRISVSSPRIDAVASKALSPSREQVKKHLASGGVLLNYQPARKPGHELSVGDIVSVRKGGTFRFCEILGVSKKGRVQVEVEILSGP